MYRRWTSQNNLLTKYASCILPAREAGSLQSALHWPAGVLSDAWRSIHLPSTPHARPHSAFCFRVRRCDSFESRNQIDPWIQRSLLEQQHRENDIIRRLEEFAFSVLKVSAPENERCQV